MTTEEYIRIFKGRVEKAKVLAALAGAAEVVDFVPEKTGALRRSVKVAKKSGSVFIITGQGIIYTRFQYGGGTGKFAKRHVVRNGALGKMISIFPRSEKGQTVGNPEARYSASYRYAIKNGLLAIFPDGVQWYNKLSDRERSEKMQSEFIRGLNGR